MAIGTNFQESLQKALCSMEEGLDGLNPIMSSDDDLDDRLRYELSFPGPKRIFYVADAIRSGWSNEKIFELCGIDFWFLNEIRNIIEHEKNIQEINIKNIEANDWFNLKKIGFSDSRLSALLNVSELDVRMDRIKKGVTPVFKRVDTCAAEFLTSTCYMYSTYGGECESNSTQNKKVMVLGSGPNRIGQGIEFDYCCVHASLAMQEEGYESIMVNCNPETVSTDFDVSNRLYFEPITSEKIMDIIEIENPYGAIIQFGGQTPLKLASDLEKAGVNILGTDVDAIDRSEDRERFQELVEKLTLKQPMNSTVRNIEEALVSASKIGYPIVVRPSYVLGGRAMQLVHNDNELKQYLKEAVEVSNEKPILLDSFLTDAIEVDVDVISDGTSIMIGGILQHIEQAGIHSGDSACSLPPYNLSNQIITKLESQSIAIAEELEIKGLMNIQFAVKDDDIYIIEVNPRASRTVPFISKAIGNSLVKAASKSMIGKSLQDQDFSNKLPDNLFFVKEAVLPFDKFPLVDPILGPEMKSTGEVMGIGKDFGEAYAKAQKAANKQLARKGIVFISVKESDKKYLDKLVPDIIDRGFKIVATIGTAEYIEKIGYPVNKVNKVMEGRPHIVDQMVNGEINLVINTTEGKQSIEDSASIRQTALQNKIFCTTTMFGAYAIVEALNGLESDWSYIPLQEIH
jgi:carbamoyl-phosphate synthase large subunit